MELKRWCYQDSAQSIFLPFFPDSIPSFNMQAQQHFDHLLILDFEATGDQKDSKTWEIIEFPCVILNLQTLKVIDEFRSYEKPINHAKLSDVCKEVTKITQETVDAAPNLDQVSIPLSFLIFVRFLLNFMLG